MMSKTAIKALTKAQDIITAVGVSLNLVGYLASDWRKNWRNADQMACLLIDSVANAFQCENSETLDANLYDNMTQAVTGYIESNLDTWNQAEFSGFNRTIACELMRLAEMVEKNAIFEAHAAALIMNHEIDALAQKLADRRCYWMNAIAVHNTQQEVIAQYKRDAFNGGPRVANHIIKVIVNARRIAKTLTGYLEVEPKPVSAYTGADIPF
ncbi:MAG: hypothetical protein ACRDCA_12655 [Serratia sp. (in: enterobacteria)]|uniref:hypothetical protein n=1 Tax=Serratia sp. (in: enterobacteria) TaxID=616 RepID=UPI003F41956D